MLGLCKESPRLYKKQFRRHSFNLYISVRWRERERHSIKTGVETIMSLPTPNQITWTEWSQSYKISTPTFQLTPIEKPDMSSLLVHMTGRNAILSILRGDNAPSQVPTGYGYLKANIPQYDDGTFNAPVVCFSETPTFALDFFRYRSFRRWKEDQRYGIGFDKGELVKQGVRPVLYVDSDSRKNLIYLYHQLKKGDVLSSDQVVNRRLVDLLNSIYPFLFPLLEDNDSQGFMWEREWRYPDSTGFTFAHTGIKVICCPDKEESAIKQILGLAAKDIDFIRIWREYDDITHYLRRQQPLWKNNVSVSVKPQQSYQVDEAIKQLSSLIQQYKITLHSLESYEDFISYLQEELQKISHEKSRLSEQIEKFQKEVDSLNEKKTK